MPKLDLHSHTTASDGVLAPAALVALAHEVGLTTLAITDHDSTGGLAEARAAAAQHGLELITGVEFGCDMPHGEVHVLGYLFDPAHPAVVTRLAWLREGRVLRGQEMVEKLNGLGVPVAWERVQAIAGTGSVGRPHVAQALVEGGFVADNQEAFTRYLAWGGPAYVPRRRMRPAVVIALMAEAGGVASLAHPARIPDLEAQLPALVEAGLTGLETYYGEYDRATVEYLAGLAAQHNLVPTGGSDYHARPIKDHAMLGAGPTVPADTISRLQARCPPPAPYPSPG
ncbi:MAG TPA: PHP domain-containing protein [Chloroflexia bacterium]|nr:PHP domain-containing protein [Chloroflexia bacterium]